MNQAETGEQISANLTTTMSTATDSDAQEVTGLTVATVTKNTRDEIRVRLTEFRGHQLCDVRQFTQTKVGQERTPTRKGVSINVALIPALIEALREAEAQAKAAGLMAPPTRRATKYDFSKSETRARDAHGSELANDSGTGRDGKRAP